MFRKGDYVKYYGENENGLVHNKVYKIIGAENLLGDDVFALVDPNEEKNPTVVYSIYDHLDRFVVPIDYKKTVLLDPTPEPKKEDMVNHPSHYNQGDVECIDAIESALGEKGFRAYLVGNIMKYLWRYEHKKGLEDIKKAQFYINRLVSTYK